MRTWGIEEERGEVAYGREEPHGLTAPDFRVYLTRHHLPTLKLMC